VQSATSEVAVLLRPARISARPESGTLLTRRPSIDGKSVLGGAGCETPDLALTSTADTGHPCHYGHIPSAISIKKAIPCADIQIAPVGSKANAMARAIASGVIAMRR
jgi:hypothetical protein